MVYTNRRQFCSANHHSIAPGAIDWFPDGQYAAFSDSIGVRRESGFEDPAVGFLSVPHEKLSRWGRNGNQQ